jgi:RES domain-containing protein
MPLDVFRVCRAVHARLDGSGARLAGGRWNSPGRAIVYTAESVALAVLENLVNMSRVDFPTGYVITGVWIPDHVTILPEPHVRRSSGLHGAGSRALGDFWIESSLSAVMRVPSVVAPGASNYLLNPAHVDFRQLVVKRPMLFEFDPRLFR